MDAARISFSATPNSGSTATMLRCAVLPIAKRAESDHRVPGDRHQAILSAVLLHIAERREWEVESDHQRLFGRGHVVKLVPGLRRLHGIDVEHDVPVRIAQEQLRNVGYSDWINTLDEPDARANDVWPGVCPCA